jgi:23S rRNA A2030 N6-methylase RlmJ
MSQWTQLRDRNPENRVAGNRDDWVKHTTFLALLAFLLEREPWASGLWLRECHAGRGVYALPPDDARRADIQRLAQTPLGRAQRRCLADLDAPLYAGSAALVSGLLDRHLGAHHYEAYEWDPQTRRILRSVVGASRVLGDTGDDRFDGETHIAEHVASWGGRDVVLMDPFGIWDRDKHAERRARYERIFARLDEHPSPPVWAVYFTWRHAQARAKLPAWIQRPRVEVTWNFGVPCALWIAPPSALFDELASRLSGEIDQLPLAALERSKSRVDELPRVHVR